jgi:hypothetical protein
MLHAYCVTDEEFAAMSAAMADVAAEQFAGRIFVLWAAEEIRRNHASGALTWDFLLDRLGRRGQREAGIDLVVSGMSFWHRKIRKRASDQSTLYLFSLMAEGGLPDAFLARGSGYAAAVLGAIGQIEREAVGSGDNVALDRIAARCIEGLPAAFQARESKDLLRDLAIAFVELRRALPDMPSLEAALLWLDRNQPRWAETLPLRLSSEARQAILLPALSRQVERPLGGSLAQRLLVPAEGGRVWVGAVRILRGGLLPYGLLPTVERTLVLRLVAAEGSVMRASPETGGWRLEAPRDLVLPLEPWAPAVFTAYADGLALAEVVVDPGLPEPAEVPLFWRAETPPMPHSLVPASGGKSRSDRLWLLAADAPRGEAGIMVYDPLPGPGGQVWPLSGEGRIRVGDCALSVATGAEADSPTARLLVMAASPREGRVAGGLPAYIGTPRFLGAREDLPLRDVTAQVRAVAWRDLGAYRFDWIDGGEVIASTRAVLLPAGLAVALRQSGSGLDVEVAGLPHGWRLAVELDPTRHVLALGDSRMTVSPIPAGQGEVVLEFFDAEGRSLRLLKPYPAHEPMLIDAEGRRLTGPRQVSLANLLGWRGVLPARGALELRMPDASHPVGFGESGTLRLAGWRAMLAQAQALSGADGLVGLRLVTDRPSPELKISRHDWQPVREGALVNLGSGQVALYASTVHAPVLGRQITASGWFDPSLWLGDVPQLWFVQGRSERGVMRPFPWSAAPVARSTRQQRIDAYLAMMAAMMSDPMHPGWTHLADVLGAARAGGDCGSLDQAQALGKAPDVAVALLFRSDETQLPLALELETEAPLWWPAVPLSDWAKGIGAGLALMQSGLLKAGFDDEMAHRLAANHLARIAGTVALLRPELSGHLGKGMVENGLGPFATVHNGQIMPLGAPPNPKRLADAAGRMAARGPTVPQGASRLPLVRLVPPSGFYDGLAPILAAPLVVAEVALGLRPALTATETLDLLALRHADPQWFDTALPLGLSLA